MPDERPIGLVTRFRRRDRTATLHLEAGVLRVGDYIHITGPGLDLTEPVLRLERDGGPVDEARAGDDVRVPVSALVDDATRVYLVPDPYDAEMGRVLRSM